MDVKKTNKQLKMNLQPLLDKKRWSLTELAKKSKLNYKTIHSIARNKYSRIGIDTLQTLCLVLQCDIEDLFVWE